VSLVAGCWLLVAGQNFPDKLGAIGDFRGATAEYLREGDTVAGARCLLLAGDTAGALKTLMGKGDTAALLTRARIFLAQWRIREALATLEGAGDSRAGDSLAVLACIMLMDFESAENEAGNDSGLLDVVDFARKTAPTLYSPVSAARLSCLPGLGHFYVDEPLRGIWALAVNAGVLGFIGYSIYRGYTFDRSYYMDAMLIYNFFFNRFYTGAGASAERTAREKNEGLLEAWLAGIASQKGFDPLGMWGD
jgi:hypothetical protein